MIYVVVLALFGFFILGAFIVGFNLGMSKPTATRIINPAKAIKESIIEKHEQEERDKQVENERIILENIDNYDGTGSNQQDLL